MNAICLLMARNPEILDTHFLISTGVSPAFPGLSNNLPLHYSSISVIHSPTKVFEPGTWNRTWNLRTCEPFNNPPSNLKSDISSDLRRPLFLDVRPSNLRPSDLWRFRTCNLEQNLELANSFLIRSPSLNQILLPRKCYEKWVSRLGRISSRKNHLMFLYPW